MTAQLNPHRGSGHRVNDRVQVHQHGQQRTRGIRSIHRRADGVEYVVRLDASHGGTGAAVNIWTTGDRTIVLMATPAAAAVPESRRSG